MINKSLIIKYFRNCVIGYVTVSGLVNSFSFKAAAQITPDSTLPNNSSVTRQGNTSIIENGTTRGSNLFHSFREFSVNNGAEAFFNNASNIQNIITRVTGPSVSDINGLIRANDSANLFLINPNGIVFGQNASLQIGGSFVGSTADTIQFGNLGKFSATNPEAPSPLLTINPSALLFNQINQNATIQNNSTANAGKDPTNSFDTFGLRVPDGRSLLLLGGDVNINSGGMVAFGGNIDIAGVKEPATVELNQIGNNFNFKLPSDVKRGDILLTNEAGLLVRGGGSGSITLTGENINISNNSSIGAGILSRLGSVNTQAGDITLDANNLVNVDNSFIFNNLNSQAIGNAGKITINAQTVNVNNGGQVGVVNNGEGSTGDLTIRADGKVELDGGSEGNFGGLFAQLGQRGKGTVGNISVETGSLNIRNGAVIRGGTFGQGNAGSINLFARDTISLDNGAGESFILNNVYSSGIGNTEGINITIGSLSVTNGAQIQSRVQGQGNSGKISIVARDNVTFDGQDSDGFPTGIFTTVGSNRKGNSGGIDIRGGSIFLTNGAFFNSSTFGEGNAGSINIFARDTISLSGQGITGTARSGIQNDVGSGGAGDSGGIFLNTGSLFLSDKALISSNVNGRGNSGGIDIVARDLLSLEQSGELTRGGQTGTIILSRVNDNAEGNSGNISIKTGSLRASNAQITTSTRSKGNSGDVIIEALSEVVLLRSTDIFTEVTCACDGESLRGGEGNGGDIRITAASLVLDGGSNLRADTEAKGNAGNIILNVRDTITFSGSSDEFTSGAFSQVEPEGVGRGGDIIINTGNLFLSGDEEINTRTQGQGDAGNIFIDAKFISLTGKDVRITSGASEFRRLPGTSGNGGDINITTGGLLVTDGGKIFADSRITGGRAGNININSQDLILRRNGSITTDATGSQVAGGNININTGVLAALENSRISANSDQFLGGNINIQTQGLFLSPDSQITATGATSELSGNVNITALLDPSSGLVEIPINLADVSRQISPSCVPRKSQSRNNFVVTGRGGLPISPSDPLQDTSTLTNWVTLKPKPQNSHSRKIEQLPIQSTESMNTNSIVEATGWVTDSKGKIHLIASAQSVPPQYLPPNPNFCPDKN